MRMQRCLDVSRICAAMFGRITHLQRCLDVSRICAAMFGRNTHLCSDVRTFGRKFYAAIWTFGRMFYAAIWTAQRKLQWNAPLRRPWLPAARCPSKLLDGGACSRALPDPWKRKITLYILSKERVSRIIGKRCMHTNKRNN